MTLANVLHWRVVLRRDVSGEHITHVRNKPRVAPDGAAATESI